MKQKEEQIIVLKKAKDFNERRMASCNLPALVIKIPLKIC